MYETGETGEAGGADLVCRLPVARGGTRPAAAAESSEPAGPMRLLTFDANRGIGGRGVTPAQQSGGQFQ